MFQSYIRSLLQRIVYRSDEDGIIIAKIPGYSGYFAQGETYEEARENLADTIETIVLDKIYDHEPGILEEIRSCETKEQQKKIRRSAVPVKKEKYA